MILGRFILIWVWQFGSELNRLGFGVRHLSLLMGQLGFDRSKWGLSIKNWVFGWFK